MQKFNLIEELNEITNRESELRGEIRSFLTNQCETNRTFSDDQKVEVFDSAGKSMGIGFVASASCSAGIDSFEIKRYIKDPYKWEEDLKDILYIVMAMKKDGTKSVRRLIWQKVSQTPKKYDYYLTTITPINR